MRHDADVIIIGAGPAGLTAARRAAGLTAARRAAGQDCRVLLLDKAPRPGVKLLIAGGGKGNLTNRRVAHTDYVGENPAFARNALALLPPGRLMAELEEAGIALEERDHGRIFCRTSANDVLRHLLAGLPTETCRLETGRTVTDVSVTEGLFTVRCDAGAFSAPRLVLATGSPAWSLCGADDSGMRLAHSLGHRLVPCRPVLTPLVMPPTWPLAGLAGISLPVRLHTDAPGCPAIEDALLFTHKGVSGPAVLEVSCWWRKGAALTINFLPGHDAAALLDAATGKATPLSLFSRLLPDRVATALLDPALARKRVAELSRAQRNALSAAIHAHTVTPLRNEGLPKAEAAAGGVDTREVNPKTLESRLAPGLFFCGEVLDIAGRLGGYNLHWAFASGIAAGEAAGRHTA